MKWRVAKRQVAGAERPEIKGLLVCVMMLNENHDVTPTRTTSLRSAHLYAAWRPHAYIRARNNEGGRGRPPMIGGTSEPDQPTACCVVPHYFAGSEMRGPLRYRHHHNLTTPDIFNASEYPQAHNNSPAWFKIWVRKGQRRSENDGDGRG